MIMTNRQFIELWFFLCSCKTVWYGADGTLFQAFYFLRSDYRHFGCCHYCPYDYRADLQIKEKGNLTNSKLTKERDCMKKKLSVIAVIILVLAICVSAWFYGYYNHKSNDNLPTLAAIAEMSEADVNSLLPGYHIDQLREVWGKPDTSENGTACWKIGNDTILVVSYKNNGIVAICGLKDDSDTSIGE